MGLIAALVTVALVVLVLGIYWLPSILGYYRRGPDLFMVVVINALLGWTVIGWFLALAKVLWPAGTHAASEAYAPRPRSLD